METNDFGVSPISDDTIRILKYLDEYQSLAVRTAAPVEKKAIMKAFQDERIVKAFFGAVALAGEAGELLDEMKKVVYHGHEFSEGKYLNEVGDILWYVARICDLFNVPLSLLATENIEKLRKRYPEGKFSTERSIHREG